MDSNNPKVQIISREEKQMYLTSTQYVTGDILIDQGHTDP